MNYLIIESKLEEVIYKYIDKSNDFKSLEQFDCSHFDYDMDLMINEICFENEIDGHVVLTYYPIPEEYDKKKYKKKGYEDELELLPAIQLDRELKNIYSTLFKENWEKPFKKWFLDKYGFDIKTFF